MKKRNRKYKDLTGKKYGKLTVVGFGDYEYFSNGNRVIRWDCICDCGKEVLVRATNLTSGHTKSCGCLRYENRKPLHIDMTGMVFGSWKVLEFSGSNEHREALWKCQCNCGNVKQFRGGSLRNGIGLICKNCRDDSLLREKESLLIGKRFGKWLVSSFDDYKPIGKSRRLKRYWTCLCDCGTVRSVLEGSLLDGVSNSCGCTRIETLKEISTFDDLSGQRFGNLLVLQRVNDRIYPSGASLQNYECQCSCGRISYVTRPMLISGQTRSCGCMKQSHMEQDVETFLKSQNLSYQYQWSPDGLFGVGGGSLVYDFYICHRDKNYAIECQGEQHYRPVDYFGGQEKYAIQKEHDFRKKEYCLQNNIRFLEVTFLMDRSEIEDYLFQIFFDEANKQN